MRISLSESSRDRIFSELKKKYKTYNEASRKLGLSRSTLKNYRIRGDLLPEDLFYKIITTLSIDENSLSFKKIKSSHDLRIKTRHPPNIDKVKECLKTIKNYDHPLSVNELFGLPPEAFLEFNPEVVKLLFNAGRFHFGTIKKLSDYLNLYSNICGFYSTSGVKHSQVKRIEPLIRLLKNEYGLNKIPCSVYEEKVKHFVTQEALEQLEVWFGNSKNPRAITEIYEEICNRGEVYQSQLTTPSIKKDTVSRVARHLVNLGLIKRRKGYNDKGYLSMFYSSTGKMSSEEFSLLIKKEVEKGYGEIYTRAIWDKGLSKKEAKIITKIYTAAKNGIEGFEINYNGELYVAQPKKRKTMHVSNLQKIANKKGIAIYFGNSFIIPSRLDWFSYKRYSHLVFDLFKNVNQKRETS